MTNIAYIQVSPEDQGFSRQEELFNEFRIDEFYKEKIGNNIKDRPELQKMMSRVKKGDIVFVVSIYRFGRSLQDFLELFCQLDEKGVRFKSIKESEIDTVSPNAEYLSSVLSLLERFKSEAFKQRQAEGIAIAKAKGIYRGRAKIEIDPSEFSDLYERWRDGEIQKKFVARKLGISMATLDRRIAEHSKNK